MTDLRTLSEAEMAQAQALDALREASEAADRLAGEQWAKRQTNREAWAKKVIRETTTELDAAERSAYQAFRSACVEGDARGAYLDWITARAAVNAQKDREMAARGILGTAGDADGSYRFRDVPAYSVEVDRALSAEASNRLADAQGELQLEINALDAL